MVAKTRRKTGRKTATRRKPATRRKVKTQRKASTARKAATRRNVSASRRKKRVTPLIVSGDGLLMPPTVIFPTKSPKRASSKKRKAKTGLGRLLDAIT